MTGKKAKVDPTNELRREAERLAKANSTRMPKNIQAMSPEETRRMLHELQVHQIELEMQNDELRRSQSELDASRARYFDLYDLAPVGYCTVSEDGKILEANITAATLLGTEKAALIDQLFRWFLPGEAQETYDRCRKKVFEIGEPQACDLQMRKKDGTVFWAHLAVTAAQDADGAMVSRVVISDITELKRADEKFEHLAIHDQLTGLLNRYSLEGMLNRTIAKAKRGVKSSLLYMDLDNFKDVNDSIGHNAGDEVLITLAGLFMGAVRTEDIVFRLGGDEFAVLLDGMGSRDSLRMAERLRAIIEAHRFELEGRLFPLSISIGLIEIDGSLASVQLLSRADAAMYRAKAEGKNRVVVE